MAKKNLKDTDYLYISTYLRARERNLLTAVRMERMIDAPTAEEAGKVLREIGYGEFSAASDRELGQALAREREALFEDLYRYIPDKAVVDVFKVKYDYHNLKALLKAQAMGVDGGRLLVNAGRVPAAALETAVREGDDEALPPALREAAREARQVLSTHRRPPAERLCAGPGLLRGDALLRRRLGQRLSGPVCPGHHRRGQPPQRGAHPADAEGGDFLRKVLFPGGTLSVDSVLGAAWGGNLEELYRVTAFKAAAEAGAAAARGGDLTRFEKLCDDAVTAFAVGAKRFPFGVEAVIGYLVAKEIEFTAVRVIMSGKMAGIDGDTIRQRLREAYV